MADAPLVMLAEDIGPKWLDWPWVQDHTDEIRQRLLEHIELTVLAVLFGLAIALPLALLSVRYRRLYGPVLAITGVLYTIPSLALFAMLLPLTGLSRTTALVPLVAYTLLILVRNTVTGLDGVPADVKDAAVGMGYSRNRELVRVELPRLVGIRIATVTTIAGRDHGRSAKADSARSCSTACARLPHPAHRRHVPARARSGRRSALVLAQRLHPWSRAGKRTRKPQAA
jgi:osmoprotectant transport system permease protein